MSLINKWCLHEDRIFLVTFKKSEIPPKLLCKKCYDDCNFTDNSFVDLVFNFETDDELR